MSSHNGWLVRLNLFFFFLAIPVVALFAAASSFPLASRSLVVPVEQMQAAVSDLADSIHSLEEEAIDLGYLVERQREDFRRQDAAIGDLTERSGDSKTLSDDIYEQKILAMLGPAVATHRTDRTEIKIFQLAELGYRGYIAKVKLFDPQAFKVVLAQDNLGKTETTSAAAARTGAIFAINGGGFFYEQRDGQSYARLIGNTVIDGHLVEPFNGYPGDLFFAGINRAGQVIGAVPQSEADIRALNPYQGVSFIPVLLRDSQKLTIPDDWKKTKQPRTIIGKYANDDLILIVIDGRQGDWSIGVTLELLQDKLLTLGVKEAYNLDGGGSSAMYFNGRILNRPSDGHERPVPNNIVILP